MPGKIKVKVLAGRNLPVMDRAGDTTDAFVEIKFGGITHKTDVCRKSLNPHWSSTEWYRFEVDESELQDEPLQLRLMDHDTYSANDAIGKVVISLAPLLAKEANNTKTVASHGGAVMSGWIPVFDTMHGIRGELNIIVKVELFSDFNKYKTSSCGVQFFHCKEIPPGYRATAIHGFVEELVVNDDPEYQWIDKIRTPRASNEARQVAFIKLSNQVQRLVGLKAAELGANAVVGYQQDFDLEGEAGVVARAIGTAVSITPLPTPSQPLNIPPCTQQQLKKYLDILAIDGESITDMNEYFQSHQEELQKLLNILNPRTSSIFDDTENMDDNDDEGGDFTRSSSTKTYTGNASIYLDDYMSQRSMRHLSEDQGDLNKLLNKNDDDSDSSGPLRTIKKIKTNFLTKRFSSIRSRSRSEKSDDQISIKSNSSDTSRISLLEIKNEFKKLRRFKKPKVRKQFVNIADEGIGMASVLARSVIHAHTSLACIAETQDSEPSPNSTMRRTSESEPMLNLSDEEQNKVEGTKESPLAAKETSSLDVKKKIPDISIKSTSLKNLNSEEEEPFENRRKLSDSCPTSPVSGRSSNLLKTAEVGYSGSVSSALSGESSEVYTSSEDDEESLKTDTDPIETVSSVVQTVLNNDVNPKIIAQMERKLSIFDGENPSYNNQKHSEKSLDDLNTIKEKPQESTSTNDDSNSILDKNKTSVQNVQQFARSKSHSFHFKFHNPFSHKKVSKSISAPSSPVEKTGFMYRSSCRIKRQFYKISNSNMMKSLSHYSLILKKKPQETKKAVSESNSSSDVPSKAPSHETVLGSPFLSYTDLLSLDKEYDIDKIIQRPDNFEHSDVKMYIGSEPVSRASYSGPSSLYEESHNHERKIRKKPSLKPTGLVHTAMETILMDKVHSLLVPTSPDGTGTVKDSKFFDDVSQRLEKLEESKSKICETPKSKFSIESEDSRDVHIKRHESDLKPSGLIQTAMQTILIDKMQNILAPMSAEISKEQKFFDDVNKKLEDLDVKDCKSDICETQRTTQGSNSIESKSSEKQRRKSDLKPSGLIQTAMQTILIDKVENILAPIPIEETEEKKHDDDVHRKLENIESRSRIFETSKSESPIKALKEVKEGHIKQNESDLKPSGLIQTAMKTILIDKVQDILAPVSSDLPEENNFVVQTNNKKDEVSISEPKSRICETPQSKSSIKSEDSKEEQTIRNESDLKTSGVIQTAKPSILIAKEQNVSKKFVDLEDKLCRSRICETPESISATNAEDKQGEGKESSKGGMIQTAMQTILFDKVQNLLAPVSSESSENVSRTAKNKTVETIESSSQDSVNSDEEPKTNSHKMSKELMNVITPCKITRSTPVLQHFHPILSGPNLETIPSLPESQTESLDIEGVEHSCDYECDPNLPSVCDNSHAACDVDRSEREKIDKEKDRDKGSPKHSRHESYGGKDLGVTPVQNPSLNSSSTPMGIHRRSSDSDLSVTPKGGSLNTSAGNTGSGGGAILRPSMNSNNLDMLEYPFLTMTEYPPGFIVHIGGTVCARSVKLVEGEGGGGAAWWAELRTELRAHARALRCHAVLAYTDTAQMCEDVCILSASGTAAVINLDCNFNAEDTFSIPGAKLIEEEKPPAAPCSMVHVPYSPGTEPYRAELSLCATCRRARVPAVLLATCAKPSQLSSHGKSVLLTAVAGRIRRAPPTSEPGARDISDQLPFLEYELHKLLLAKLRMQGANALFSLQTQITAGERCVMALASGAAVRLAALPAPTPPTIKASENDKEAIEIQKKIWDTFTMNKTANGFDIVPTEQATNGTHTDTETTDAPVLDLCSDKDACLLELDEAEDVETAKSLAVRRNHMQVYNRSLKASPANPHAFAQVWRARLPLTSAGNLGGERHVARCLDNIHYKLRTLAPLALAAPRLAMQLPEDEIQVMVSGTVIPLLNPTKADVGGNSDQTSAQANGQGEDDEIFSLDEEQMTKSSESKEEKLVIGQQPTTVSLTTLPEVSGSRSVRAICALKLLFVRETTAVRELGGLSGFLHTFTCEVLAIVRAYTTALGGNALTSFYINQLMLQDNAHKNQGQCLVSVGGDIVHVTY